jgi:hypothetical protein
MIIIMYFWESWGYWRFKGGHTTNIGGFVRSKPWSRANVFLGEYIYLVVDI